MMYLLAASFFYTPEDALLCFLFCFFPCSIADKATQQNSCHQNGIYAEYLPSHCGRVILKNVDYPKEYSLVCPVAFYTVDKISSNTVRSLVLIPICLLGEHILLASGSFKSVHICRHALQRFQKLETVKRQTSITIVKAAKISLPLKTPEMFHAWASGFHIRIVQSVNRKLDSSVYTGVRHFSGSHKYAVVCLFTRPSFLFSLSNFLTGRGAGGLWTRLILDIKWNSPITLTTKTKLK